MQKTLVRFLWREDPLEKGESPPPVLSGSPEARSVESPPAMRETWVPSLGWEDPLEEGMATHSRILAWRIPMNRGDWRAAVHEVSKSWTQVSD